MPQSKTALLELRSGYEAASGGEEILEQKRNILLREIMSLLDEVERRREEADETVRKSYRLLVKAFMESGRRRVEEESRLVRFEAELEVFQKSFVGIVVPEVRFVKRGGELPLGYTGDSLYLDMARVSFSKAVEQILELSGIEIKIWRLARELRKTVVRLNALKNYYLPKYEKEIARISASLEEGEREFLVMLKMLTKEGTNNHP